MIEVKNLKKTYVTKGNVVTKALDDVSLKFPEKGLVFLLGKSGSGKSTLLNICGGLDKPDSGEIIIMGKSSSTFSGSDFDSYRNTFIGFIFQEYNILNEFNIEENLSLALELQGKKANKAKVKELLEQVDLVGFEKRKPNTMSGGQKQRVAIARALIKEPKIIMADEPTGALDSKTGKQVFDTLKKLSQDHLVIVVSHDREFAEIYGDRIIELKDGQVLSDETKTHIEAKPLNENIAIIGDNTLSIKKGATLTAKDKDDIIAFITKAENNVIISNSEHDIKSFKEANRISSDDRMESFASTNDDDIKTREYSKDESKFIKSKMPMSKAARMGISSLKVKPIRLLLTMILTIISFLMFGVASSLMNYNEANVIKNSFSKSDYESVMVTNSYQYTNQYYRNGKLSDTYTSESDTIFTKEDMQAFKSKYGNDTLAVYSMYDSDSISITNLESTSDTLNTLKTTSINGFATANEGSKYTTMVFGNAPSSTTDVAISEYMAKAILNEKLKDPTSEIAYTMTQESDLIGKTLSFNLKNLLNLTICGIYKGDAISSDYTGYADTNTASDWSSTKVASFKDFIEDTSQLVFLITEDAYNSYITTSGYEASYRDSNYNKYFVYSKQLQITSSSDSTDSYYSYAVQKISNAAFDINYINGNTADSDGIVLPLSAFTNLLSSSTTYAYSDDELTELLSFTYEMYVKQLDATLDIIKSQLTDSELNDFMDKYYAYFYYNNLKNYYYNVEAYDSSAYTKIAEIDNNADYQESQENYYNNYQEYENYVYIKTYSDDFNKYNALYYFFYNIIREDNPVSQLYSITSYTLTDEESSMINKYFTKLIPSPFQSTVKVSDYESSDISYSKEIIGYYIEQRNGGSYSMGIYCTDNDFDTFVASSYSTQTTEYSLADSDAYYKCIFVPTSSSDIFSDIEVLNNDSTIYSISNTLYNSLSAITSLVGMLKKVFFWIGLVLAAFSALLLFNFITVSISSKTHEIGVLRAVGARGKDVFKIFFSESLFISLLAFIIALIGAIIVVVNLNTYISNELTFTLHLLDFGILSVLIMLAIAVAVAVVGTFIPVTLISRKKPVDSLRSL